MEHLDTDLIELAEALRDPEVWQPQRLIPTPQQPERIAVLANFKKRLDDEDDAASSLLDEALKGPSAWWTNSLRKSGVRTAGIVRQLLLRMRAVSPRVPVDALVGT
ncbi:MAG TPA: hypothetical protein VGJ81_19340, partial [Thermoanaerobaculia bacterium]